MKTRSCPEVCETRRSFLAAVLVLAFLFPIGPAASSPERPEAPEYLYVYDINGEGDTAVKINFTHRTFSDASSWLIVPSYTSWLNETVQGTMLSFKVQPLITAGKRDPFWNNYTFAYAPVAGSFILTLTFQVPQYAYIIEPDGFFLSSNIGYSSSARGSTLILLPEGAKASRSGVRLIDYASGEERLPPSLSLLSREDGRVELRCENAPSSRVAVFFTEPRRAADVGVYTLGRFSVQTARRYENKAWELLRVYNASYPILAEVFGVSLERVNVTLLVPTLDQFLSGLGGFVPFSETTGPGLVHLNMLYFRKVSGFIEIIALHELVHHLVWKAGFPPRRLWVHEGMAGYFSIEVAKLLGFLEGAREHEASLSEAAGQLGDALGFVQSWTAYLGSGNVQYYAAAWKVFKTLGDRHGGLEYYGRFFRELKSFEGRVEDSAIVTSLGLAAGDLASVVAQFEEWGFKDLVDVVSLQALLREAQRRVSSISALLQPSKALAELTLRMAQSAFDRGAYAYAFTQVKYALFFAAYAFQVTLLTFTGLALGSAGAYWYLRLRRPVARLPLPPYPAPAPPERLFCYNCGTRLPPEAFYCPECGYRQT